MTPPPSGDGPGYPLPCVGDIELPPRVCSKEGGEAVPRTRGPWRGGPKAHGPEARKPSHPHGRRQHRPSAEYPFSLIREIRKRSLNHEINVELP